MTYRCPKCKAELIKVEDRSYEVIFYCSNCKEYVKAKRMGCKE